MPREQIWGANGAREQMSLESKCRESNCRWGTSVAGATALGEQVFEEQLSRWQLSGEQQPWIPLYPLNSQLWEKKALFLFYKIQFEIKKSIGSL